MYSNLWKSITVNLVCNTQKNYVLKIEKEIKSFQDKNTLKEMVTSHPNLQRIMKGILQYEEDIC